MSEEHGIMKGLSQKEEERHKDRKFRAVYMYVLFTIFKAGYSV